MSIPTNATVRFLRRVGEAEEGELGTVIDHLAGGYLVEVSPKHTEACWADDIEEWDGGLAVDGGDWKPGDRYPTEQTPEPPGRFRQDMHTRRRLWIWRAESIAVAAAGAGWAAFLLLWVSGWRL